MEKITQYVENLFFDFPKTEEVARLKMQIIDSLVEKYQDLISSGKNEDEAFGIVVAEFGNIEELKKEFDIPYYQKEAKTDMPQPELSEDVKKYREAFCKFQMKYALMIGFGVVSCILGIIISISLSSDSGTDGEFMIAFLLPVAVGVFLFIVAGITHESLKKLAQFENTKTPEKKRYPFLAIIMPIATIIFLLLGSIKNVWHPAWVIFPIAALLSRIIQIVLDNRSHRN